MRWGAQDGKCFDDFTLTASSPQCVLGQTPIAKALDENVLYNRIIGAWSMRGFTPGVESGHDHFLAQEVGVATTSSLSLGSISRPGGPWRSPTGGDQVFSRSTVGANTLRACSSA